MPMLAALLGNAFSGFVAFLGSFISKKIAIAAALGTFLVGGWIALQLALHALWVGVGFVIPVEMEGPLSVVAYVLPSNMNACISALALAKVGRWLWDRQREWALAVVQA